jgi:deoxyguanosine kinase
LRRNR